MTCVNKADLNLEAAQQIEDFARSKNVTVLGRIPFDPVFTKSMVQGQTIFEYDGRSMASQAIKELWRELSQTMDL